MSHVHEALGKAGENWERMLHNLPLTRPSPPDPAPPPQKENDGSALIAATFEVKGLERFLKSPILRLSAFAALLIAALAPTSVYWNNSAHRSSSVSDSTAFQGIMQPLSDVKVTALEPGIVIGVKAHIGDVVNEGEILVKLDSREAEASVSQAQLHLESVQQNVTKLQGELAQTEAKVSAATHAESVVPTPQVRDSVQHAQAVYDHAHLEYERNEALYKEGIISGRVVDDSDTALRIAADDLANAKKVDLVSEEVNQLQGQQSQLLSQIADREQSRQLKEAKMALQMASVRLANADIRAASSGVISAVSAKVGDLVSVGAPLVVISRTDRITVNVPVTTSIIASLHKTQQAKITLPTMPPQEVLGTIRSISPIPSANMTHNVEVEFENPTGQLLAGQPAEVRFVF